MDAKLPGLTSASFVSLTLSGSPSSTPSGTPSSTPSLESLEFVGAAAATAAKATSNPLPPLAREFPRPANDINVTKALERQPGRWSMKGQMEANRRRALKAASAAEDKEKKARDFEAAKRDFQAYRETFRQQPFGKS